MENFVRKHQIALQRASLLLLALLVLGGVIVFGSSNLGRLTTAQVFNASTNLICLIALSIICVSIFIDLRKSTHITLDAIYFVGVLIAQCITLFCIESAVINADLPEAAGYLLVAHTFVYAFSDIVVLFWWRFLSLQCDDLPRWHAIVTRILDALFMLTVLASLSNIFGSNVFFSIDDQGTYHRSDTYILCLAYTVATFIASAILLASQKSMNWGSRIVLFCYILIPIVAVVWQFFAFGLTLIYIATSFAITFVFGSVFVSRGRDILQKEAELSRQNASLMLSQIKPHFLYNSLTAIADLCDEDPTEAKKVTLSFASYLRGNMDSINEKEPIPFSRELSHVRSYLEIEKARFGDKLNVKQDIQVRNFCIPALTLQPIVENAVKYGVKGKRGPGTITISTKDYRDEVRVVVQDDGPGFDVNAVREENESRSHMGITNVNRRLESMVGGSLEIVSSKETGTRVTLHIPLRGGEDK